MYQDEINLLLSPYQCYIITKKAAEHLQRDTDGLVYYGREFSIYAWGIVTGDMNTNWKNEPSTVRAHKDA